MIQVVKVKLLADAAQLDVLTRTLETCNAAATAVAKTAFERSIYGKRDLRMVTYRDTRDGFQLGSQVAQSCIRKVADSYKTFRANLKAGRYGKPGSNQYLKVTGKAITFRGFAAQPYDDRCLSWVHDTTPAVAGERCGVVSLWTVDGRLKDIKFTGLPEHIDTLRRHRSGETDLVIEKRRRDGRLTAYLVACVDVPAEPLAIGEHLLDEAGWIGVDLGICNIAVTSDRTLAKELMDDFGEHAPRQSRGRGSVKAHRDRHRQKRRELQTNPTKSKKRRLAARAGKEARYATDVNHQISNRIVAEAKRTGRGISLEELKGIRERVRQRKPQRAEHTSWAFAQLGEFIRYKAERAGVPFIQVDPRNTSKRCHCCGFIGDNNRTSQDRFRCQRCGYTEHADLNGSDNIGERAALEHRRDQSTSLNAA